MKLGEKFIVYGISNNVAEIIHKDDKMQRWDFEIEIPEGKEFEAESNLRLMLKHSTYSLDDDINVNYANLKMLVHTLQLRYKKNTRN